MQKPVTVILLSLLGAAIPVTYAVAPPSVGETLFQLVAWGSLIAFGVGITRHRQVALPWVLIGAGFALFAVGDLLWVIYQYGFDIAPFPSPADAAYLIGYPLLAVGLSALVRRTRPGGDRIALIDAGIIVVPAAVAMWIYLVEPYASGADLSFVERAVSAGYPIGDLLCLAVVVRLLTGVRVGGRSQQPALALLFGALVSMLAADVWFLVAQLNGSYAAGGWGDSLYLLPYMCLAAAALHPSVRHVGLALPPQDVVLGPARLSVLALSAIVTPSILVVQWFGDGGLAVPLVVGGTVATFLLVVARMAGLVRELEVSRARLQFDATHDLLTGLANRMLFSRRLSEVLEAGRAGSLLFIDLDRFKQVNDTFGHRHGDRMLVEVAARLQECVRSDDLAGRLAGDEFVVLIASSDQTAVHLVAERILSRLKIDAGSADDPLVVTASIGLISWGAGASGRDADDLLSDADRAMYRAKDARGNQLVILRSA